MLKYLPIRIAVFVALFFVVVAAANAQPLPWLEENPAVDTATTSAPPAKFFPINPAALMRPPMRDAYGIVGNKPPAPAIKRSYTNGTTSINEEQAKKLLEMYAN